MKLEQAIESIKWNKGRYAKDAVDVILHHQEQAIPYLLNLIDVDIQQNKRLMKNENYMGHIYALYILAKRREQQAFPYIFKMLRQSEETLEMILGDLDIEAGARWLVCTYDGNLETIKVFVEDTEVGPYMRAQGLKAIALLVLWEKESRGMFVDYCKYLMDTQDDETLISELVDLAERLCLKEIRDEIKALYINNRVDTSFMVMGDILPTLRRPVEERLAQSKRDIHLQYIDNIEEELRGLICFGLEYIKPEFTYPISNECYAFVK